MSSGLDAAPVEAAERGLTGAPRRHAFVSHTSGLLKDSVFMWSSDDGKAVNSFVVKDEVMAPQCRRLPADKFPRQSGDDVLSGFCQKIPLLFAVGTTALAFSGAVAEQIFQRFDGGKFSGEDFPLGVQGMQELDWKRQDAELAGLRDRRREEEEAAEEGQDGSTSLSSSQTDAQGNQLLWRGLWDETVVVIDRRMVEAAGLVRYRWHSFDIGLMRATCSFQMFVNIKHPHFTEGILGGSPTAVDDMALVVLLAFRIFAEARRYLAAPRGEQAVLLETIRRGEFFARSVPEGQEAAAAASGVTAPSDAEEDVPVSPATERPLQQQPSSLDVAKDAGDDEPAADGPPVLSKRQKKKQKRAAKKAAEEAEELSKGSPPSETGDGEGEAADGRLTQTMSPPTKAGGGQSGERREETGGEAVSSRRSSDCTVTPASVAEATASSSSAASLALPPKQEFPATPVEFKFDNMDPRLRCLKPDCRQMTSCWDSDVVICPACGVNSFTRYCRKAHLYEDIQRHWTLECGRNRIPGPVDRATIRPRQLPPRAYLNSRYFNLVERHRQAVYRAMEATADYFIFGDIDKVDESITEPTREQWNLVRGTGDVVLRIDFPRNEKKQQFDLHIRQCLLFGKPMAEGSCLMAFHLLREALILSGNWTEKNLTYLIMQLQGEWGGFEVPEYFRNVQEANYFWRVHQILPAEPIIPPTF